MDDLFIQCQFCGEELDIEYDEDYYGDRKVTVSGHYCKSDTENTIRDFIENEIRYWRNIVVINEGVCESAVDRAGLVVSALQAIYFEHFNQRYED